MTREQAKKLLSAMTHFINGGNLWYYNGLIWNKQEEIYTQSDYHFDNIIEDQHFELRKKIALGMSMTKEDFEKEKEMNGEHIMLKLIKDMGVISTDTAKTKQRRGLYECPVCEEEFLTTTADVKAGKVTKCRSCSRRISSTKHKKCDIKLYKVYHGIKTRCLNLKNKRYMDYGGRGITVCDEWLASFEIFEKWALANGYEEGLSIERKDNDGDYEPSNCKWATQVEQRNNQRLSSLNKTGWIGVSIKKSSGKFVAQIKHNDKQKFLGYYDTAEEAALVYDDYIITNKITDRKVNRHYKARKAFALGEEIETSSFGELWEKVTDESALWTAKHYRPNPKEPIYEYQWVVRRNRDGHLEITKHITDSEFICNDAWQATYKIPESKRIKK